MEFKDYFSAQSEIYAKSRPKYPEELFRFLSSLTPAHDLAWDCATGNGQAAVPLTNYFKRVIATDASEQQLKNAIPNEKINYYLALAENSGIKSSTVDLITIAAALHWMNFNMFYKEVDRVLKPHGIFAAINYYDTSINDKLDALVMRLRKEILADYWPPESKYVFNGYTDIPFPFKPINTPQFQSSVVASFDYFCGYLFSWSGSQRYLKATGKSPVDSIIKELENAWGDITQTKKITWNLVLKIGQKK